MARKATAPLTPQQAAIRAKAAATKKQRELERLKELRRLKALDRMQLQRKNGYADEPEVSLKLLFGGKPRMDAVKTCVSIMRSSKDDELRFAAAKYVLDRTDGPIVRDVTVGGRDGAPIMVSDDRPALAQLLGSAIREAGIDIPDIPDTPTIDGDPIEEEKKDDPEKPEGD